MGHSSLCAPQLLHYCQHWSVVLGLQRCLPLRKIWGKIWKYLGEDFLVVSIHLRADHARVDVIR